MSKLLLQTPNPHELFSREPGEGAAKFGNAPITLGCFSPVIPPPHAPRNGLFNSWLRWICTESSQDVTALMKSISGLITGELQRAELRLQLLSTCMAAQQSHRNPRDKGCPELALSCSFAKPWDMSSAGCRTRGTASGTGK